MILSSADRTLRNLGIKIEGLSQSSKHYLLIYYIRQVELRISFEYPRGLMRTPVHLCVGQEAIPVGLSENLIPDDKVLSNHRSHGHYLAKGGSLESLFGEILGKEIGCARGRGGSQHLIDLSANFIASAPILGGTVPIATGIAFSNKLNDSTGIVTVYLGDAVLEEGVLYESLSFAALHALPILFVVENNRLSVHTSLDKRQPSRKLSDIGRAFGLRSEEFDGNDIEEVSRAGKIHIDYVRKQSKPSIVFFETFRRLEHVGPGEDFDLNFRDTVEVNEWLRKDPLEIAAKKLRNDKFQVNLCENLKNQIDSYIESAWQVAFSAEMAFL
jgi:TPP-dependent pyruvate/acetoin dehydrogenase alpha subunit